MLSERVKGIAIGKLAVNLYRESRQALLKDDLILDIGKILAKFSQQASGNGRQRKERDDMIDALLKKVRATKQKREEILADTRLITKLMSTEGGPEADKIREEIEQRHLFD